MQRFKEVVKTFSSRLFGFLKMVEDWKWFHFDTSDETMMTLKRFQVLSHSPSLAAAAFSANQCSLGFNNVQLWSSIITNVQQYDKLAKLTNLLYLIMEVPVRDDLTHRFPQIFEVGSLPIQKFWSIVAFLIMTFGERKGTWMQKCRKFQSKMKRGGQPRCSTQLSTQTIAEIYVSIRP